MGTLPRNGRLLVESLENRTLLSADASLNGDWPTFGASPAHTGYFAGTVGTQPLVEDWSLAAGATTFDGAIAVAAGKVFVPTGGGQTPFKLEARDPSTGKLLWSHQFTAGNTLNPPTYYNGRVYLQRGNHSADTQLWALDASNGNTVWSKPFSAQWESYYAPAVSDQGIWIDGGYYGGMYGFRADGTQITFVDQEQYDQWTPSLWNNNVYAYVEGKLSKYSTTDGSLIWSNTHTWSWDGWSMNTISALDGTRAYVIGHPNLYGIELATGATSWTVTGNFSGSPAVAGGTVYANSGTTVKAYDTATVAAGLTYTADQALVEQPIITDDALIVASNNKTYVFSRSSGTLLQTVPFGGKIEVANNHLYIASPDRSLHTFVFARLGNQAPSASADNAIVSEDSFVNIDVTANDSDPDGDVVRARGLSSVLPAHGTVTVNDDGTLRYTPQKDFFGTDSFTYAAVDGRGGTTTATVNVTVNNVNDPPVASAFTVYVPTAGAPITLKGTDVDGDALTYAITTVPQHGTISSGTNGTRTFTPAPGYIGADSFAYTTNDGNSTSAPATVTVYIDDAPIAQNSSTTLDEDTSVTIPLIASDPNGNPLTLRIGTKPTHGTAVLQGTNVVYTPVANYFGTDQLTFIANDGIQDSNAGVVSLTVLNVNETPIAKDDVTVALPAQIVITPDLLANDSDVDGGTISLASYTQPKYGTISALSNNRFAYKSPANFHGTDTFTYTINDGQGGSATGTVAIAVGTPSLVGDWSTFGNGPAHTGYFPGAIVGGTLVADWSAFIPAKGTIKLNQVAVGGGRVYVTPAGSFNDTYLAAYDVTTGQQAWRHAFAIANSINPPTYDSGRVYTQRGNHSTDTQLWSIDAASGNTVWSASHQAQWEDYMAPTVADAGIFVNGGYFGGMYGFNQSDGTQRFFVTKPQVDGWTPTYYSGKVYANVSGTFVQHNPLTGAVEWSLSIPGTSPVPAITGGRAFVSGSLALAAIDLATHAKLWQVNGSFGVVPAVANGIVYAMTGMQVKAYNATTGALVQTYSADTTLTSQQPIVTDDGLLVSSSSATYLFDLNTGTLLQKINIGGALSLANGVLYIADGTGTLHTFKVQAPGASTTAPDLDTASDTGSSSTDNITTVNTPSFSGSGVTAGSTVALFVDGVSAGNVTADGNGNWQYTVPSALSEGTHQIAAGVMTSAGAATSTLNFTIDRTAPTANPGGAYSVNEGASKQLNASASSDAVGIASIEWDLDYDGTTFNADATGATPTFSAANLDGPAARILAIRVTDLAGNVSIATTSLNVLNIAPTATFSNSGPVTMGSSASVSFTNATDVSADVTAGLLYSFDFNNDGVFEVTDSSSSTATVPASYLSTTGSKIIAGRIKDKDGDFTDYTTTITVNPISGGSISGTVYNESNNKANRHSGEEGVRGVHEYKEA
jgi:outer membrane protein assembly factor BamB